MNTPRTSMDIYRALVVQSDPTTGNVYVKIPHVLGSSESIALHKPSDGQYTTWAPSVNSQVLVAVEGNNFDKVYLISVI